jgi:hypothetical protein
MVVSSPAGVGVTITLTRVVRVWRTSIALSLTLLLGGAPRTSQAQAHPRTHLLIVTGSSGEPRFATEFHALAMGLRAIATTRFEIPDSQVTYLAEQTTPDPRSITGRSTREGISQAIDRIAARASAGDAVLILLIGHGTGDGEVSRFNVPGMDMSDADFDRQLDKLSNQVVAFVNAASASGDFVKKLSGKNRVIVTATKSGFERNETLFASHFVGAYVKDGADADKDGRVSLLEAFAYTRREVQREYETTNRLQTEHAMMDDDGDGTGRADPGARGPDGTIANRFFLQPTAGLSASAASDPRVAELLAKQATLQAQLDTLRLAKSAMKEADYLKALEDLLTKISENASALRAIGVRKP